MHCAGCLPLLSTIHAYCYPSDLELGRTLLALTIQDVLLCLSTLHRDGWRCRVALLPVLLLILQQESTSCQMHYIRTALSACRCQCKGVLLLVR